MFHISVPYCKLDNIYKSQQTYRWIKIADGDYIIPHCDKIVRVKQNKDNLLFSCNEEEFYNTWFLYFDMITDYAKLHYMYRNMDDEIKIYCNRAKGMHVINQDLFMIVIASILESKTNDHRVVEGMIYDLCMNCGKKHKNSLAGTSVTWYEFPNISQIIKNKNKCFVYEYIENFILDVKDGWFDFTLLNSLSGNDLYEYLLEFEYIDSNCVNRIMLNSLGYIDSIPVDDDIEKLIDKDFDMDYDDFISFYTGGETKYFNYLGYLYYVMKYNYYFPVTKTNYDFEADKKEKRRKKSRYGKK